MRFTETSRTKDALLLAHDEFWNGHNFEQKGRNTFLFKDRKEYFVIFLSQWQGERAEIVQDIDQGQAWDHWVSLEEKMVSQAEAFPR